MKYKFKLDEYQRLGECVGKACTYLNEANVLIFNLFGRPAYRSFSKAVDKIEKIRSEFDDNVFGALPDVDRKIVGDIFYPVGGYKVYSHWEQQDNHIPFCENCGHDALEHWNSAVLEKGSSSEGRYCRSNYCPTCGCKMSNSEWDEVSR